VLDQLLYDRAIWRLRFMPHAAAGIESEKGLDGSGLRSHGACMAITILSLDARDRMRRAGRAAAARTSTPSCSMFCSAWQWLSALRMDGCRARSPSRSVSFRM